MLLLSWTIELVIEFNGKKNYAFKTICTGCKTHNYEIQGIIDENVQILWYILNRSIKNISKI